jgi:hypothetical protein
MTVDRGGAILLFVADTADEILEQVRGLPAAERLRVAERIVREVADEVTPVPRAAVAAIWSDESDEDFQAFQAALKELRANDVWRTSDAPRSG